ncbi:MAG: hypothetical protein CYPHOPRED_003015 [Cyphobasidiales sp. Tagirdzhanova-0007]|nr:MAG: hypothetical protein CYPHOPRED_003015 [Cyphobasidiales sp. Tagirdzhanova-0007]
MPGDTYQHTHKSSSFANFLYQSSLFFLIFLISVVLLATGYDIAQQVIPKNRGPVRFSDTAITAGGYLLVGLASAVIGFSRLYTVRKVLASIPKGYLPLGKDELNKNVCRLAASEYTRCAMIVHATSPQGRTLPGWGAPGTDYAGVRFRSAILQTLDVLEAVLPPLKSSSSPSALIPTRSKHASPLAKYMPLFGGDQPIIPNTLLPLLNLYEKYLEDARWRFEEPSEQDYENCLRIVAVLVDVVGKRKTQAQT